MTKAELIDRIYERMQEKNINLPMKVVDAAVCTIIDSISEQLVQNKRAEFRGFGSFSTIKRNAYTARNPRTGEYVTVPVKRIIHFKAGRELRHLTYSSISS
jgi:integration host factor subunit beta